MAYVETKHADYNKKAPIWRKCRDMIEGQEAIHEGGTIYLDKLTGQSEEEYIAYKNRATVYNASQRTVQAMTGVLFRKNATFMFPESLKSYLENIDMNGTPLTTFAEHIAKEVISVGRVGILAEHPVKTEDIQTLSDAEAKGFRPYLSKYKAEDIINWDTTVINGIRVLNLVVLREILTTRMATANEFVKDEIERYRVLDLFEGKYRQRMFLVEDDVSRQEGEDMYPTINGQFFNFIPFFIINPTEVDANVEKPPLLDLINLNISHYKTTADLEHGAHFTGLPTAIVTGFSQPEGSNHQFKIGSAKAWVFSDSEADAKFLEFTGQGLSSLEKRIEVKEHQMATLGARLLASELSSAESAETHDIKRQGENSALASIAQTVSNGITRALRIVAMWAGKKTDDVWFLINKDLTPGQLSPQMLTALVAAWQSGAIPYSEFVFNLQQGEILDVEKTHEEFKEEIDAEGPKGLGLTTVPPAKLPVKKQAPNTRPVGE